MFVDIYHNIRWPRYKGLILGSLHRQAIESGSLQLSITHIADTMAERVSLGSTDLEFHQYPHRLLYQGSYEGVGQVRLSVRLAALVLTSSADAVVIPGYHEMAHWAMLLAARLGGKRVGVFCDSTLNGQKQSRWKGRLKSVFFRSCDFYFAYGSRSAELLRTFGAKAEWIMPGCQAAALPLSYHADSVLKERSRAHRQTQPLSLLFVGRLASEKNIDLALRAFARLANEFDNSRFRIVGAGPDLGRLQALARELGIDSRVIFAGAKNTLELADEYIRASYLVLPSSREAWGLVVNEALHYGCPVVVSDSCGCTPELVLEGRTGVTFESGSLHGLEKALRKAISLLPSSPAVAGQCIEHMKTFTTDAAAERMLRLLQAVSAIADDS